MDGFVCHEDMRSQVVRLPYLEQVSAELAMTGSMPTSSGDSWYDNVVRFVGPLVASLHSSCAAERASSNSRSWRWRCWSIKYSCALGLQLSQSEIPWLESDVVQGN